MSQQISRSTQAPEQTTPHSTPRAWQTTTLRPVCALTRLNSLRFLLFRLLSSDRDRGFHYCPPLSRSRTSVHLQAFLWVQRESSTAARPSLALTWFRRLQILPMACGSSPIWSWMDPKGPVVSIKVPLGRTCPTYACSVTYFRGVTCLRNPFENL